MRRLDPTGGALVRPMIAGLGPHTLAMGRCVTRRASMIWARECKWYIGDASFRMYMYVYIHIHIYTCMHISFMYMHVCITADGYLYLSAHLVQSDLI